MNSKPVLAVLVSGLLGLVVGCEPAGPKDITLTAPPAAVSPVVSKGDKVHGLSYTISESSLARAHAVQELTAQGLVRCANASAIAWTPYVYEKDGKRIRTVRQQEFLFLAKPPRVAMIELVRLPEGTAVKVEVEQLLTGEIVETRRARHCNL